jgi:hypothetical protein
MLFKGKVTGWGCACTPNDKVVSFWLAFVVVAAISKRTNLRQEEPCDPDAGQIRLPMSAKNLDRLIALLRSVGYDRSDLLGLDPDGDNPFDFKDKEIYVTRKGDKWRLYLPTAKRVSRERLVALSQEFAAKLKQPKPQAARKPVASN